MAFGKKNEVKIDPLKYNIALLGESGIGKTTIIKEMCEELGGQDSYIFLEMAGEAGADAIQGIVYEDVDDWDMVEEIVSDIEDNKTTEYKSLKTIVIDTYDGWINLAQDEAIRLWNKAHPDKRTDSIDSSWNGFQKGQLKAFDLMFSVIKRLRAVGVATIVIAHVKNRDITDVATGITYQQLTSDVEKIYFNLLKKKMHFIAIAYFDRTIVTEKTGKKNIVTKKEKTVNKISEETRKIRFRDPEMAVDSKSRFADIIPECSFNVDAFINVLKDAIKKEASKGSKSIEELEVEQAKEEAENLKCIAEAEANAKIEKQLDELKSKIVEYIAENKTNMAVVKPILEKCAEYGYKNPIQITDLEAMKAVAAMIEE